MLTVGISCVSCKNALNLVAALEWNAKFLQVAGLDSRSAGIEEPSSSFSPTSICSTTG